MAKVEKEVVLTEIAKKLKAIPFKAVIVDEIHCFKNDKAQRSMVLDQILTSANPEYIIGLSGTPCLNRPVDWVNPLRLIRRLDKVFGGYIKFTVRYCDGHKGRFGWDAKGATNVQELNRVLRESGSYIRREKKEVLPELPEKTRVYGSLSINNRAEYESVKKDLYAHIYSEALKLCSKDKKFQTRIKNLSSAEQEAAVKAFCKNAIEKTMRAQVLVEMQKLEAVAARGKVKATIEWIENFLESGEKLIAMASSKELLDALLKAYPNAPKVVAGMSGEDRLANAERFQNDPNCKLILGAMGKHAGACPVIGLNLQAASHVALFSMGWTEAHHIQCEDRALRIGSKNAVTSYWLPAENTFEEEKMRVILKKAEVTSVSTTGNFSGTDAEDTVQAYFLEQMFAQMG